MYALWRHPSCLHTLTIISSRVSLFRPFSPYSGLGSSCSHAEFVVAKRPCSPYSGLGSSSSHAEVVVAKRLVTCFSLQQTGVVLLLRQVCRSEVT